MQNTPQFVMINNTGAPILTPIYEALFEALKSNSAILPEEIADLFSWRITEENGVRKGFVGWL